MIERFVVIDVETANPSMDSICQVGLAVYEDGQRIEAHSILIDPEDDFDEFNIAIHGITPDQIEGRPNFEEAFPRIEKILGDGLVASYGHFDKTAVQEACDEYDIDFCVDSWVNLHAVVRRAWPEESKEHGVALAKTAKRLGVTLNHHHDAKADAIAAGEIFLKAITVSGIASSDWRYRIAKPVYPGGTPERHVSTYEINPEGALLGEGIVFTGALSMSREQAREAAAKLGCAPLSGVSKKTTILVVGDQDIKALRGANKSSKHRKAEELILKGHPLRILGESDFMAMLSSEKV